MSLYAPAFGFTHPPFQRPLAADQLFQLRERPVPRVQFAVDRVGRRSVHTQLVALGYVGSSVSPPTASRLFDHLGFSGYAAFQAAVADGRTNLWGAVPDVVEMPDRWLALYANNGKLENLEPYLEKWEHTKELTPRALELGRGHAFRHEVFAGVAAEHRADYEGFLIGHDHFHSTHSPENEAITAELYGKLLLDARLVVFEKPLQLAAVAFDVRLVEVGIGVAVQVGAEHRLRLAVLGEPHGGEHRDRGTRPDRDV